MGGLLVGLVVTVTGLTLVLGLGVQAVEDTGLVGERGTFTVDSCDHNPAPKHFSRPCFGDFVAHGDSPDEKIPGRLDNASGYPDDTKVDAVKDIVLGAHHFRKTGTGEVTTSLLVMCTMLLVLWLGVHWTRKWARTLRT